MLDPAIQELLGYNSSHKFTVIDRHQMFIVLLTSHRYAGIFGNDTNHLTNLRYRRIDWHQIFIVLLASHSYAGIFGIQIVSQTYGIVELIDTNALSLSVQLSHFFTQGQQWTRGQLHKGFLLSSTRQWARMFAERSQHGFVPQCAYGQLHKGFLLSFSKKWDNIFECLHWY